MNNKSNVEDLNVMILNNVNIGISEIELNEWDLLITDKSLKYCLQVCIKYNWEEINSLKVGEKKNINFNEYCLAENNEAALVWPDTSYLERLSDDSLYFHIAFRDLAHETHYMNKRGHFDIELKSLEVKIFINYKDAIGDSIIYKF